jgi:WD40 repeat protein
MRSVCWFVVALCICVAALSGTALAQQGGWFGAEVVDVTKAEADKLGWDAPHGAKVSRIEPGSPAEKAGLKVGDILLLLDRMAIDNAADCTASLGNRRPGTEVRLRVLSGSREIGVAAVLGERQKVVGASDTPILQLDTGGHMGVIYDVAFTPDGRHLVSAGQDKVVRVWDRQVGTIIRTIRGEAGPGGEGQVYAMALSPDGRWLAVGGNFGTGTQHQDDIRLYDFATGRLAALLKGHTNSVLALAFAPDSKRLISGSTDYTAIIWNVERRTLVHRLKGHTHDVPGVGFSPDSARAVTSSFDKTLKLWSVAEGKQIAPLSGHKDRVRALAISSTDGLIASGSADGEIRLWDGRTGRFLRTLGRQGGYVGALRFSPNGKHLLSTCGYAECSYTQRFWDVATGEQLLAYSGNDNGVVAAALSADGQLVATAGGNSRQIDLWNAETGQLSKRLAGKGAPGRAAAFSVDGRHIAWGNTWASGHPSVPQPLEWQLRLALPGSPLGVPERLDSTTAATFLRARTTQGASALAHRKGGDYGDPEAILDVSRNGKVQASITRTPADGYRHNAYTFAPDGQSIVSGGDNGFLATYDLQGKEEGEFIGHESDVWAVTPSADGRLLVSAGGDQTIRLWNLKTRELIVTLFHGTDGEWVMWTPQGYYTGSPGADKIVGWQINKGAENAADYIGADQLREHLNRPDIIDKAIILASAEQAVREAAGTSFRLADLLTKPVPRFRIVSPATGSTQRGGRVQVKIAIEGVPDPVKAIRVQVNGRSVESITPDIGAGGLVGEQTFDVPLAKGRNEVRVALANATGEKAEALVLDHEGDGDLDKRGTLYILAIGVDRYPAMGNTCGNGSQSCDLRFAGADARAWADAAERRLAASHTKVVKQVLINGADDKNAPTANNITDAIDALRDAAEDTDTVLLFIAGHGLNDGADYRFLATNAERTSSGALRGSTVVPWQTLQGSMEATKGRRVLFLDTCHSGNAYSAKLGNSAYHANIITYASARFDQEALEDAKLGHGLFTYAVAEGLDGKGGLAEKREISTKGLAEFVIKRVDELAKDMKGSQEPQYFRGRDAEDYVLARW